MLSADDDSKKVKEVKQKVKDQRRQELDDIRTVMSNASGRRLMWKMLERCGTFRTIFNTDSLTMSYHAGQQDLGHFLMAEIVEADENLLLKIMKDNKKENL